MHANTASTTVFILWPTALRVGGAIRMGPVAARGDWKDTKSSFGDGVPRDLDLVRTRSILPSKLHFGAISVTKVLFFTSPRVSDQSPQPDYERPITTQFHLKQRVRARSSLARGKSERL
jgi:hypothetical protein